VNVFIRVRLLELQHMCNHTRLNHFISDTVYQW